MSERTQRRVPGEPGLWILVIMDLMSFGLLFVLFTYDLGAHREMFMAGQDTLSKNLGLVNTLLLLTGSWSVVLGVEAAQRGAWGRGANFIAGGMLSGLGFMAVKAVEYTHLIQNGHTVISDRFWAYYFMITGIHLAHVIVGVAVLGVIWNAMRNPNGNRNLATLEAGGVYWHMVDLLWIGIFVIVYLMR